MRHEPQVVAYLELATLPSAPFWARRQTQASLTAWQLPAETTETAQLLVSELTTNAIKASGTRRPSQSSLDGIERISLTLRLLPGRLVIEVSDRRGDHRYAGNSRPPPGRKGKMPGAIRPRQ